MNITKAHEDRRGYTYSLKDDNLVYPEVSIFFTKKGFARGGCIHDDDEYFCVVSGEVCLVLDGMFQLSDGMVKKILKDTPHYFVAQTNCIVMEWGCQEKGQKDPDYRDIVKQINENQYI